MVTLFAMKVNCFFPIQKLLRVFILHFQSGRKRPRETVSAEVVAVDVTPDSNGTRPHAGNSRATGFPGGRFQRDLQRLYALRERRGTVVRS